MESQEVGDRIRNSFEVEAAAEQVPKAHAQKKKLRLKDCKMALKKFCSNGKAQWGKHFPLYMFYLGLVIVVLGPFLIIPSERLGQARDLFVAWNYSPSFSTYTTITIKQKLFPNPKLMNCAYSCGKPGAMTAFTKPRCFTYWNPCPPDQRKGPGCVEGCHKKETLPYELETLKKNECAQQMQTCLADETIKCDSKLLERTIWYISIPPIIFYVSCLVWITSSVVTCLCKGRGIIPTKSKRKVIEVRYVKICGLVLFQLIIVFQIYGWIGLKKLNLWNGGPGCTQWVTEFMVASLIIQLVLAILVYGTYLITKIYRYVKVLRQPANLFDE